MSKDLFSKGLKAISNGASQLERLTAELADKAEQNRREQQRNKPEYYRQKIKIADAITHDQMLREYSAQAYFLNLGLDLGLKNFKFEDIYNTETYKNKKMSS